MKRKRLAPFLVFAVSLPILIIAIILCRHTPSSKSDKTTLRIPDTHFMGILPLYVADEKGFFVREGLKIEWIDIEDPGQAGKMFFTGQADFTMTTFANLIPAEVRRPGTIRLLFPIYESSAQPGSYILTTEDSGIKNVFDLKGKTLGTYSGPSQKTYALIVLKKLRLKEPEDVRLVQVATSAQVQGLFGGAYDALFTVETYGSMAIENGARIVEKGVRTKYISDPFWLGSAAIHTELARDNPKAVKGLLNALHSAAEYIIENEDDAREILARRSRTEVSVAKRCALYTWVSYPDRQAVAEIQEHIELLVQDGLIDKTVRVSDLMEGAEQP